MLLRYAVGVRRTLLYGTRISQMTPTKMVTFSVVPCKSVRRRHATPTQIAN